MIWSLPSLLLTPLWPVGLAREVYVSFLISACDSAILTGALAHPALSTRNWSHSIGRETWKLSRKAGTFPLFAFDFWQPLSKTVRVKSGKWREICAGRDNSTLNHNSPNQRVRT